MSRALIVTLWIVACAGAFGTVMFGMVCSRPGMGMAEAPKPCNCAPVSATEPVLEREGPLSWEDRDGIHRVIDHIYDSSVGDREIGDLVRVELSKQSDGSVIITATNLADRGIKAMEVAILLNEDRSDRFIVRMPRIPEGMTVQKRVSDRRLMRLWTGTPVRMMIWAGRFEKLSAP